MAENCAKSDSDSEKLLRRLKEWDIVEIYPYLKDHITYRSLEYLSKEDLLVIPHIGLRAEFREKLLKFREKVYNINVKVILSFDQTFLASLQDETNHQENKPTEDLGACSSSGLVKTNNDHHQDVSDDEENESTEDSGATKPDYQKIFQNNDKGKKILESYENKRSSGCENQNLITEKDRRKILEIILSGALAERRVQPKDFSHIRKSIIKMFPTEEEFKDCYYTLQNIETPKGPMKNIYEELRKKKQKPAENEGKKNKPNGNRTI